jgi:DhnA family fructose-bisphosphate aldolase class Ia
LGGEAVGDARPVLEDLRRGMAAGPNVRGAMIGRNVLYPGADDPRAIAAAVSAIVHDGSGVAEAIGAMEAERGKEPELT